MKGVLIIAHGSRALETELTLDSIVSMVKTKLPGITIECAFMEFSDRTINNGLSLLVDKGIKEIIVIPYFLFMGNHLKKDIPDALNDFISEHPDVNISLQPPLGDDARLCDIIVDKIQTANN